MKKSDSFKKMGDSGKGLMAFLRDYGITLTLPKTDIEGLRDVSYQVGGTKCSGEELPAYLKVSHFWDKPEIVQWFLSIRLNAVTECFGVTREEIKDKFIGVKFLNGPNEEGRKKYYEDVENPSTLVGLLNRVIIRNREEHESFDDLSDLRWMCGDRVMDGNDSYVRKSVNPRVSSLDTPEYRDSDILANEIYGHFILDSHGNTFACAGTGNEEESHRVTSVLFDKDSRVILNGLDPKLLSAIHVCIMNCKKTVEELLKGISLSNGELASSRFDEYLKSGKISKTFFNFYDICVEYACMGPSDSENKSDYKASRLMVTDRDPDKRRNVHGYNLMAHQAISDMSLNMTFFKHSEVAQFTNNPSQYHVIYNAVPSDITKIDADESGIRDLVLKGMDARCPYYASIMRAKFGCDLDSMFRLMFGYGAAMDASNRAQQYFLLVGPGGTGKSFLINRILKEVLGTPVNSLSCEAMTDSDSFIRNGLDKSRIVYCDEYDGKAMSTEAGKALSSGSLQKCKRLFGDSVTLDTGALKIFLASNGTEKNSKVTLPGWADRRRCVPIMLVRPMNVRTVFDSEAAGKLRDEAEGFRRAVWAYYISTPLAKKDGTYFIGSGSDISDFVAGAEVDPNKAFVNAVSSGDLIGQYFATYDNGSSERTEGIQEALNELFEFTDNSEDEVKTEDAIDRVNAFISSKKSGRARFDYEHMWLNPENSRRLTPNSVNWRIITDVLSSMGGIYRRTNRTRRWTKLKLKPDFSPKNDCGK